MMLDRASAASARALHPRGAPLRVAIIKLSSLGDVVHALPVAATLRARLPGAHLTWIVERREAAVLRDHPAIDALVAVDTRGWRRARGLRDLVQVAGAVRQTSRRLRAAAFDVALDLQGLLKSGVLAAATGAPLRIGFAARRCREPLNALFTNRRVAPPPAARHVVDQHLSLLVPLEVTEPVREFRLPVEPAAESRAAEFLACRGLEAGQRLVVLNPGAGRPGKRWPEARFRALAERLTEDAGALVLVVWGPGEEAVARHIAPGGGRAVCAPSTDLYELVAFLRRASVLVAGDTGPLHLAAALGTPCVGLYGPTSAVRNGPYGSGHRCLQGPGGQIAAIEVDAVLHALREVLA
jgi:lipopolysaccharide heptosyltransferase I